VALGDWRVQVRRKTRYVADAFRRRKDGEEWALEMERNIDHNGSSTPRALRQVRTFGNLIDLHDQDMLTNADRLITVASRCVFSFGSGDGLNDLLLTQRPHRERPPEIPRPSSGSTP
jgi:hypothetical protein